MASRKHSARSRIKFLLKATFISICGLAAAGNAAELSMPKLSPYGTIDAMVYRSVDSTGVQRSWNLSGIRESLLGLRTPETEEAVDSWRPLVQLEVLVGANRGQQGRTYDLTPQQVYFGVAGKWGQITLGKQNNVLTNIAWSELNPIDGGWGINASDLLYIGDTFTYGNRDTAQLADAGANWFLGYLQRGIIYQCKGEGYSVQADYMPSWDGGLTSRGSSAGLGGTVDAGKLRLAGAWAMQGTQDGLGNRKIQVLGGVYSWDNIKLYLSHMRSSVSSNARYDISYGGIGWQSTPELNLSLAFADYRQNALSVNGAGHSEGVAFVADYSLNAKINLYVETDFRRHHNGNDGAQTFFTTPGIERNLMFGASYSF